MTGAVGGPAEIAVGHGPGGRSDRVLIPGGQLLFVQVAGDDHRRADDQMALTAQPGAEPLGLPLASFGQFRAAAGAAGSSPASA